MGNQSKLLKSFKIPCVNSADTVTPTDNFSSNLVAAIREVVYIQTFEIGNYLKMVSMKIVFFVNPNVEAFLC